MKCRDCPIEIEQRPCPRDVGAWSVDDACVPVERMLGAERRLREEQETLTLYEGLARRYGYDPDTEPVWVWLEQQLAELDAGV